MRHFIAPALVSGLLALPAHAQQAQDPPDIWSFFTVERLGNAVFSQLMLTARAFADITYETLQFDMLGGKIGIVGLQVSPDVQGQPAGGCVVRAQRATVRGAPFDQIDVLRVRVTLDNALVDFDCLPNEARPVVGMLGVTDIAVDRLDLTLSYNMPQGSATLQFEAGVDGLVRVIGDADMAYVSYRIDQVTQEPDIAVLLNSARVQIEDGGLRAQAERILPPDMRTPEAASGIVTQNFAGMLGGGGPLNPAQEQLVNDAGQMAAALTQGAGRIVLETGFTDGPLRLDSDVVADPATLITALAPRMSNTPAALRRTVPRDLLIAATNNTLPPETRLPVGRALITGIGAPRNRDLAAEILFPLVQEGSGEAALLLAEAFADTNPDLAYRDALAAVASGNGEGLALLDRLEGQLTFDQVMEVQAIAAPARLRAADSFGSLGAMRSAALNHMTGLGAPRSYETSYFWASMAAAGGDTAAAAIRDELDEHMRLRGLQAAWAARTAPLERDVLTGWIEADLGARLQKQ